jgi:hypothetical protein
MNLAFFLELTLTLLLALTLVYCIVLERRLSAVQKGQQSLGNTIRRLDAAIENAGTALAALKAASSSTVEALEERIKRARALADELSLMTSSGERIAERFDRAVTAKPAAAGAQLPSGSIMARLDALRAVR